MFLIVLEEGGAQVAIYSYFCFSVMYPQAYFNAALRIKLRTLYVLGKHS